MWAVVSVRCYCKELNIQGLDKPSNVNSPNRMYNNKL